MTKGQQTRREIIEKAAPLFNQKGYEGTSLSELMDAHRPPERRHLRPFR
jgi:TetR/AcrR family transcriptional regulator, transcriptional repressor for nem operon